jgi:hypothetical protein
MRIKTQLYRLAAGMALGVLTACGGGGGDTTSGGGGGGGITSYTFTAVAGASGVTPSANAGTFSFDSTGKVTNCLVGNITTCTGQLKANALNVQGQNNNGTVTVTFTGVSTSSPSSTDPNTLIAGTIEGNDGIDTFKGKFGGIKSTLMDDNMAKFAGVYGVTANTTVNGQPDTTQGHFSVDVTGNVFKCKVGHLVKCQGQLNLNPDKTSATFTISGDDAQSPVQVSATLKGQIDSSFKPTGTITGTDIEPNGTFPITGTFTGARDSDGGTKSLSNFAGTYAVGLAITVDGTPDSPVDGSFVIDAAGKVTACSFGWITTCSGVLTLNTDKVSVSYAITGSGTGTENNTVYKINAVFNGDISSNYILSGKISSGTVVTNGTSHALGGTMNGVKR